VQPSGGLPSFDFFLDIGLDLGPLLLEVVTRELE
jgi:hypothetical protein